MITKHPLFILLPVFLLPLITAQVNHPECHQTCGSDHSAKRFPYPFGFSSGCAIRLNCTLDGDIVIGEFPVRFVNRDSIIVSVEAQCNRPFDSFRQLFSLNYAPTSRNTILLRNCSQSLSSCVIPATAVRTHSQSGDCSSGSGNLSCYYDNTNREFMNYDKLANSRCQYVMSSISSEDLKSSSGTGTGTAASLEVGTIELGWWLQGDCQCSAHANCTKVEPPIDDKPGYRCSCQEGFVGDGYLAGIGCRKAKYGYGHQAKCPHSYDCGNLGTIRFPFTVKERPECGILAIGGCDNQNPANKTIQLDKGRQFNVLQIDEFLAYGLDNDLHMLLRSKNCTVFSKNYTLPLSSPLASLAIKYNTTFFRCKNSHNFTTPKHFLNYSSCAPYNFYFRDVSTTDSITSNSTEGPRWLKACSTVVLPMTDYADANDPFTFLSAEVPIEVRLSHDCADCYNRQRGLCQHDSNRKFYCAKAEIKRLNVKAKLAIGISAAWLGILMVLACYFTRKVPPTTSLIFWKNKNSTHQIIETFLKEHGPLPATRYNYSEVKKITNYFKNKLGQGGYGSVYKGKLKDGRLVAVKVLSESKGNSEEFINEVASVSRTSHVNVVVLLGFCFQGSKRALIYEYMPNGSLEKFIYEENALMSNRQLDCKILYDIAIGVARGLEYLHRGCNTRILHFDIKPHNILLDENFCPKISDFGLAKICQRRESIISLLGARGTAGYIAPEVFSRNFGGVSYKSDVYSYGMMVLEMIGGRKNINVNVEHSSEIYFPHWIYKQIELNEELVLQCIKNDSDQERARKMIVVGLWCIQTNPSTRPMMSKVVEMLEGSLESLQVPPKPYLSSP